MGETYVTIYWIREYILMKIFNIIQNKVAASTSGTAGGASVLNNYNKKLLYFDRFLSMPTDLVSVTPEKVIFPTQKQLDFLRISPS